MILIILVDLMASQFIVNRNHLVIAYIILLTPRLQLKHVRLFYLRTYCKFSFKLVKSIFDSKGFVNYNFKELRVLTVTYIKIKCEH